MTNEEYMDALYKEAGESAVRYYEEHLAEPGDQNASPQRVQEILHSLFNAFWVTRLYGGGNGH